MTSSDISNDGIFLALCCAEEELLVVLGSKAGILASEAVVCPGQSIQHLHPIIARLLAAQHLKAKNLTGIACVSGPGSFTGLRIAHACMYGLALPFSTPMAGLEYHSLLASQVEADYNRALWVITYARKSFVYVQHFQKAIAQNDISVMHVADARRLLDSEQNILLLGSGIRKNPELQNFAGAKILPPALDVPKPETLLRAACNATYQQYSPPPIYLRKSDAEDNLAAIAAARGISEDTARAELYDYK